MKPLMKSKESFEAFYNEPDPWKECERINRVYYKKILLSFFYPTKQHPTIEIGCGEGEHFFSIFFNKIESKFLGIDISENAIARALNRRKKLGKESTKIDFLQGNFQTAINAIEDLKSDAVNVLILETLYYLSDDEIVNFFKCLLATNKKITLLISSLNLNVLEGREYLTLRKVQKLISAEKSISLYGCYPIIMKKKSFLFLIWFLFSTFKGGDLHKNISLLCRFSSARNNLFLLKVNHH